MGGGGGGGGGCGCEAAWDTFQPELILYVPAQHPIRSSTSVKTLVVAEPETKGE